MLKYVLGVLFLIGLVLLWFYFFLGVPRVYTEETAFPADPHVYGDPSSSLAVIDVVGFYFVPSNRTDSQAENWQQVFSPILERVKLFHEGQFLGKSTLNYRLYEKPITGKGNSSLYDTPLPQHTNYEALQRIVEELPDVPIANGATYQVLVVMYEGVGATGDENAAILSRSLFTDSFLAHEFYHALGVQDRYTTGDFVFEDGQTTDVGILTSTDLMGRVGVPLERAYIDPETLKQMGL